MKTIRLENKTFDPGRWNETLTSFRLLAFQVAIWSLLVIVR